MADLQPTSEKRERILQALSQASRQEVESSGYDSGGKGKAEASRPQKVHRGRKWPQKGLKNEGNTFRKFVSDFFHVDGKILQHKLIYFMFSAGSAGAIPYLSTFALHLGLSLWHTGLAIAAGLLAGAIFTPLWGLIADKLRWHRLMFWTVILVWFGCTVSVAYIPWPKPIPCDLARDKLQTVLPESICDETENGDSIPHRQINSIIGRYATEIHTWPGPVTFQLSEVCPCDNETSTCTRSDQLTNASDKTSNELLSTAEETEPQPLNFSELHKVFEDTNMEWLYDKAQLHRISLIVFILSTIAGAAQISTLSLIDTSTLMTLGEANRDRYGWQRAFSSLGFALSTVLVTIMLYQNRGVMTICGLVVEFTDYFLGALVFAAFVTVGMLASGFVQFQHNDMSSHHSFSQVVRVVFSSNYGCVFVTAFVLSSCNGALNMLLCWRLQTLGATPPLLVAAVVMHAVADLVTSYFIPWLVPRVGYHSPLATGIVGYCSVFISYAFMSRPGWVAIISLLQGATFAITWNMMTSFLASSVALVSQASVQGLLSGVYWGLGPAAGTVVSAYIGSLIGDILSFYALTLVCVVYGIVFLIWNRQDLPMIDKYLPRDYQHINRDSSD